MKTKLLFVCSANRWRSPTAEALFYGHPTVDARSAGTENGARVQLTKRLIDWADVIYCMEGRHADRIHERFGDLGNKRIMVLDVPDHLPYMHPELIELLRLQLAEHFSA